MRAILRFALCAFAAVPSLRGATRPSVSAPAPGEIRLEWPSRPAGLEWEAFLSLDGGLTYPIRATPHLDASVRDFTVRLSGISSSSARVRVRVGDGAREIEQDLPESFAIEPGNGVLEPSIGDTLQKSIAGESNTLWVEGSPSGQALRLRGHAPGSGEASSTRISSASKEAAILSTASAPLRRPVVRIVAGNDVSNPLPAPPAAIARSPLSLAGRLNL
jgi:hypothetical protein